MYACRDTHTRMGHAHACAMRPMRRGLPPTYEYVLAVHVYEREGIDKHTHIGRDTYRSGKHLLSYVYTYYKGHAKRDRHTYVCIGTRSDGGVILKKNMHAHGDIDSVRLYMRPVQHVHHMNASRRVIKIRHTDVHAYTYGWYTRGQMYAYAYRETLLHMNTDVHAHTYVRMIRGQKCAYAYGETLLHSSACMRVQQIYTHRGISTSVCMHGHMYKESMYAQRLRHIHTRIL
jgi:hypothetical protein